MPSDAAQEAMDILQGLLKKPQHQPYRIDRTASSFRVTPSEKDTFEVAIHDDEDSAVVTADRWHAHFEDGEQAAFCAFWLLTPYYRVVQEIIGGILAATWIERYGLEGWQAMEPVYFRNPTAQEEWRVDPGQTAYRRYAQQAVVPPAIPYDDLFPGIELDSNGHPTGTRLGFSAVESEEVIAPSLYE